MGYRTSGYKRQREGQYMRITGSSLDELWHATTSWLLWLLWPIQLMICHLMKLQTDGLISRTLWPLKLRKRTQTLLSLARISIRLLVGIIMGHCMNGRMSERMVYLRNDLCRSCLDKKKENRYRICYATVAPYKDTYYNVCAGAFLIM